MVIINGEGDLVVMDLETFTRREKMLKLREELLRVEEDRLHGIALFQYYYIRFPLYMQAQFSNQQIQHKGEIRHEARPHRFSQISPAADSSFMASMILR